MTAHFHVIHIASAFSLMHIGRMVTFLGKIGAVNTRGFVLGDFKSDIELAGAGAECPVVELQGQILEVEPMILKHPVFEFSADVTGSSTAWAKSTSGAKTEPLTRAQLSYKDHCCGPPVVRFVGPIVFDLDWNHAGYGRISLLLRVCGRR